MRWLLRKSIFSLTDKDDCIGNGIMDTTKPGWGRNLADGILHDLERLGFDPSMFSTLEITDKGMVVIDYPVADGGRNNRWFSSYDQSCKSVRKTIIRAPNEITDNQLRKWLNGVCDEIRENQWKKVLEQKPTQIDIDQIFHSKIESGNKLWTTCSILDKINPGVTNCTETMINPEKRSPMDCRQCAVPHLFQNEAKQIIQERLSHSS